MNYKSDWHRVSEKWTRAMGRRCSYRRDRRKERLPLPLQTESREASGVQLRAEPHRRGVLLVWAVRRFTELSESLCLACFLPHPSGLTAALSLFPCIPLGLCHTRIQSILYCLAHPVLNDWEEFQVRLRQCGPVIPTTLGDRTGGSQDSSLSGL